MSTLTREKSNDKPSQRMQKRSVRPARNEVRTADNLEVDFLACIPTGEPQLLPVCADLDATETGERETRSRLADARQQTLLLFQGMVARGLRKRWLCQAPVNIAGDVEMLDWTGRAGCRMVSWGLEAEAFDALTEVPKRPSMKPGIASYEQTVDRIDQAESAVLGAFLSGMDSDTPDKLRRRTDFMRNGGGDVMHVAVMTPLPGTQVFHRFVDPRVSTVLHDSLRQRDWQVSAGIAGTSPWAIWRPPEAGLRLRWTEALWEAERVVSASAPSCRCRHSPGRGRQRRPRGFAGA